MRFLVLAEKFYTSRLSEKSFTKVYLDMMIAGYEHGFVFPSELMLHAKALTTVPRRRMTMGADSVSASTWTSGGISPRRADRCLPEIQELDALSPDFDDYGRSCEIPSGAVSTESTY